MALHPILNIEINDSCVSAQHLVCVGGFGILLLEVGASGGLMVIRIEHCGEGRDWGSVEAINNSVGTSSFMLDVEVELLQIGGPLLMVVILQFSLCLHEM
jgi:hypothetical protein